jgi:hypothetical protein
MRLRSRTLALGVIRETGLKPLAVVAVAVVALVALTAFLKRRVVPTRSASANDLKGVVASLRTARKQPAFLVFMFVPPGAADGDVVNLQYSMEAGKAGFDWVFRAPRNISDEEKIKTYISSLGHRVEEKEMNGVRYLRVEDKAIDDVGFKVITEFYKIPAGAPLELITEGFEWRK